MLRAGSNRNLMFVCSSILSVSRAQLCTNRCIVTHKIQGSDHNYDLNRNNVCNDGGSGSEYSDCEYGSDCTDCGPRPLAAEHRALASVESESTGHFSSGLSETTALNALRALYESTGGPWWKNNSGWDFDTSEPCAENASRPWYGVTCEGTSVTSLYLRIRRTLSHLRRAEEESHQECHLV